MAIQGSPTTRLGAYGGARQVYGDFTRAENEVVVILRKGGNSAEAAAQLKKEQDEFFNQIFGEYLASKEVIPVEIEEDEDERTLIVPEDKYPSLQQIKKDVAVAVKAKYAEVQKEAVQTARLEKALSEAIDKELQLRKEEEELIVFMVLNL